MACSHCMGLGKGQGTRNDGFLYYTMYCTHYTGMGQGQQTIVFYCAHPGPCPCLVSGPLQCEQAIRDTGWLVGDYQQVCNLYIYIFIHTYTQ